MLLLLSAPYIIIKKFLSSSDKSHKVANYTINAYIEKRVPLNVIECVSCVQTIKY